MATKNKTRQTKPHRGITMNIKKLDENAHWWAKEKVDWAVQDKKGNYWIIPGSEFPEKKIDMKTKNIKHIRSNDTGLKMMFFIFISSFLGVILAGLLFSFIF